MQNEKKLLENISDEGRIKGVIVLGNVAVVEWYFQCDNEGNGESFYAVTIAEFDVDMKICDLKEFQSKEEHYYPYGE